MAAARPAGPPPLQPVATDTRPWRPLRGAQDDIPPAVPLAVGWAMGAVIGLCALNSRSTSLSGMGRTAVIAASAFAGTLVALAAIWARSTLA